MRGRSTAALLVAGLWLALTSLTSMTSRAQETPPPPPPPPATDTATGTETAPAEPEAVLSCSDCHTDVETAFRANAHGHGKAPKGEVIPNAVCESCHGDGSAHMEAGGDTSLIVKPVGLAGSDTTCLACHDIITDRISRHAGAHANSPRVHCLTCHFIHKAEPRAPHLLSRNELALCTSCHATQAASFRNKPYAHRIGRAGMECSSCHEPHGRPGRDNLALTHTREMPCLGCHREKRGPYVFQHAAGVAGDCTTCHEPHGSSNPKMLTRTTVAQLCMECHSPIAPGTLGSQPPSFHNLSQPRYQNCTTCHVAVHGSNRDPALLR